jgi:hypothetical protein
MMATWSVTRMVSGGTEYHHDYVDAGWEGGRGLTQQGDDYLDGGNGIFLGMIVLVVPA